MSITPDLAMELPFNASLMADPMLYRFVAVSIDLDRIAGEIYKTSVSQNSPQQRAVSLTADSLDMLIAIHRRQEAEVKSNVHRALFFCVVLFAGCGGGGGGGSTGPTSPPPTATYVPPQTYVQGEAIVPISPTVSGNATLFSASPTLPTGLTLNSTTGVLSGTPTVAAAFAEYAITVNGPSGSSTTKLPLMVAAAASLSSAQVAGTSIFPQFTIDGGALGISGTLYARIFDASTFEPTVVVRPVGNNYVLELATLSSLTVGRSGRTVVNLCRDSACTTRQAIPDLYLSFTINVYAPGGSWPGNHLTALSTIPDAPEWSTFQGNAAHTGYVPVNLDPNRFDTRWQISVPAFAYMNAQFNLATLTTESGRFYLAGNNAVTARSEFDGSTLWSYSFAALPWPSANPPAVSNGTVYVVAGHQDSTFLFAFDSLTGSVKFRSAMASQFENYLAPTVGASGVYTDGGTYGGLYAFDLQGVQRYFQRTAQQSGWTPAVDGTAVYAYTGDALRIFDPVTGSLRASISDTTFRNYIYTIGGSAVLGGPNSVFAAAYGNSGFMSGNALLHFNLQSNMVDWTVNGAYPSNPAYDNAIVYATNNNPLRLEARSEVDGSLLWSWSPQAAGDLKFASDVLLTQNLLFVSTNLSTYAIDRTTHHVIWSYPLSGELALSPRGVLYITSTSGFEARTTALTAINVR